MSELTCFDVADYFLSLSEEDAGDSISNLKLQKLVYYAQGFHLAFYDRPLFPERIEAWEHGPVVPELYYKYREYGAERIPMPEDVDFGKYAPETRELLEEVNRMFGQYSAWKLRNMTHEEPPWADAHAKRIPNALISHGAMKEYFSTLITGDGDDDEGDPD